MKKETNKELLNEKIAEIDNENKNIKLYLNISVLGTLVLFAALYLVS